MAKDLNKVQVIGRLGKDPDMRYTPTGAAVTAFSVASGRQWKDANGTSREETEWFRCVAWDKLGEICNQYLTKGARVYIEGRLKTRKWADAETGADRYSTEVVISDMIMLDSRRAPDIGDDDVPVFDEEEAPPPPPAAAPRPVQAGPRRTGPPAAPRNQPQPVGSDDIPF